MVSLVFDCFYVTAPDTILRRRQQIGRLYAMPLCCVDQFVLGLNRLTKTNGGLPRRTGGPANRTRCMTCQDNTVCILPTLGAGYRFLFDAASALSHMTARAAIIVQRHYTTRAFAN